MPEEKTQGASIKQLINALGIGRRVDTGRKMAPKLDISDTSSISSEEQKRIISETHVPLNNTPIEESSLIGYLQPIQENLSKKKSDHAQIRMLAPEINQAKAILIPSILSPNDLQSNHLTFSVEDEELSSEEANQIIDLIDEHFNKHLDFNKKLPEWLDAIIYKTGAKPIMILPEQIIRSMIQEDMTRSTGFESLMTELESRSVYGRRNKDRIGNEAISISGGEIADDLVASFNRDLPDKDKKTPIGKKLLDKNGMEAFVGDIEKILNEKAFANTSIMSVHEDPSLICARSYVSAMEAAAISEDLESHFKKFYEVNFEKATAIAIDDADVKLDECIGNPIFMELPTESVIPIHTPGSPEDHVGYFILIDDRGNPIHSSDNPQEEEADHSNHLHSAFYTMFGAAGLSGAMSNYKTKHLTAVTRVYETMLDKYLERQITDIGMTNVDASKNNNIYKTMFRRLLENKKTRLVFVPASVLTYCCFEYNEDGTGRSRLEDIGFVLSLRVTLMVARMMAAMDEAINRERISISFDPKVSDPLEFINNLRNKFMENKTVNFTYNPQSIMESLVRRSVQIVPKQIPGITELEIDQESAQSQNVHPDSELAEELKELMVLSLDVPPSALNALSEDEFAKSVATSNLFFSKKIRDFQATTCGFTTRIIRNYTKYSVPLREAIEAIIKKKSNVENDNTDIDNEVPAKDTEQQAKDDMTTRVDAIIHSIKAVLPPPNIAPDVAQYEEFDKYDQILDKVLGAIYAPELLEKDRDSQEELTMIKAFVKSNMMKNFLQSSGMGSSIDVVDLAKFNAHGLYNIRQMLLNFRKGFEDSARILTEKAEGDDGGGDSGW